METEELENHSRRLVWKVAAHTGQVMAAQEGFALVLQTCDSTDPPSQIAQPMMKEWVQVQVQSEAEKFAQRSVQ